MMNTPAADSPPISLPKDKEVALRVIPMPADANANGDIFGGWIMSQVDLAGSIPAVRRAKGRIATVAVNQFVFKQPVQIGDVVSFYATIKRVGRTSVTVDVEVYSERKRGTMVVKVTEAELTYVAITLEGKPRELPPEGETLLV
jgi:acyl-CoA thioesterase YciA